jgi:CBS domain containing-hemolysin-like protein
MFQSAFGPIMTDALAPVLRIVTLVLSFALMTFLHVVIGEVVPKNMAIERADRFAILVAPVLLVFYKIAEPFVWVIERAASSLSRLIGVRGGAHGVHSVEELKFIVSASHGAGRLTGFEQQAVERLLELRDYVVREIMVPRNKLATIPSDSDLDDVLKVFSESHYSRLLVYEGNEENILGVIHVKDVLDFWAYRRLATVKRRSVPPFHLKRILRKTPVVPETKQLDQVIDEFRSSHAHLAIVVDEFGSLAGLLTLEDVIEQVFGEIEDEFDPQASKPIAAGDEVEVEGTISLVDLESHYGIEVPMKGEYETLAGFIMFELGRIPVCGDTAKSADRLFEVREMKQNRIELVHIRRRPAVEVPAADSAVSTD